MHIKTLTLSLASFLVGTQAFAEVLPIPRGSEIRSGAGNCRIGPFERTGKAGLYTEYCTVLSDAEKCLALIKQSFNYENGETSPSREQDKAAYCLDLFRTELLRSNQ